MKKYGEYGGRRSAAAIAVLLSFMLFFGGEQVFAGSGHEKEIVRVGFYSMNGFQEYDELGHPIGYNVEYLDRIAALTDWEYEYVNLRDFTGGLRALRDREIDLIAPCEMTPERLEDYEYSDYSFGTEYSTIVALKENDQLNYEDYSSFDGMKIAVIRDYLMTEHFMSYMEENNFSAELSYYSTPLSALSALRRGDVDAAVVNLMMLNDDCKVLARFSPAPFFYLTWKGNEKLMDELNSAMRDLKNTYPSMENQLTEAYFPQYTEQYFSGEDVAYVSSLGTLNVGYVPECLPVSFTDEDTGELGGMTRDILDRIQEISGLKFNYVALPSGPVTYDCLRENKIDVITSVEYNSANLNATGIRVSNPYLLMKKVIVAKDDVVFDRGAKFKVALATGSQTLRSVLNAVYPNFEIVDYDTNKEAFEAIRKGDVDLLLQNQYVVEDWLARPEYEKLQIVPVEGLDDNLCFSVLEYAEEEGHLGESGNRLISILNKTISQISQDEIDTIIVKETMQNKYTYTFFDFIYSYRIACCILAAAIVGALLTMLYITNLKKKAYLMKKEEDEKLLLQQKRYELIIEKSEDIIYEISLRGEGCIVSDKMHEKFGWAFPEQIDEPTVDKLMDIWKVHPEDKKKLRESLIAMIDENNSTESLIRMMRADGEYIWCKVARFPLLDNDNILVSIVGKIADVDKEVKEKEKLEQQSRTDGLTKLLNKKAFMNETKEYLSRNSSVSAGFIFIDLDHFKEVNDTLGHIVGDKAIKDAAKKLQVIFANSDLVSRFGGDEFCIFVKDIPKNTLEDKLGWAVDKLKETYTDGASIIKVTASIGAVYCRQEKAEFQTLLDMADKAVYKAKENGRNQYVLRVLS